MFTSSMSRTSAVAGIVNSKGGIRVVVTQRWRMHYHVGPGETLYVVPGLEVEEPVPHGHIPALIKKVQDYVTSKMTRS